MEDLGKRAALTYCGLSLMIWFMKSSMEYQGANFSRNPAWQLVSGIFTLLKWSWWLLIGAAILLGVYLAIERLLEQQKTNRKREEILIQRHEEQIRWNLMREEEAKRKREEDRQRQIEKDLRVEEEKRREEEYLEFIRSRSPKDAVMLALKDFCKGGS